MKLSVVIPTFNRVHLLRNTVDAVLHQTRPPNEVIVVDDGSDDNTAEMLSDIYDKAIRYIRIENSGDLVARNVGTRAAGGDVVAYCDSDDVWREDFLAKVEALWQTAPAIRSVYSNFVLIEEGIWQRRTKFDDAPEGFWEGVRRIGLDFGVFEYPIISHLVHFQPFFPSCMAVDRRFFLQIGGWDEGVNRLVGCDFATALRVAEHPPIGIVYQPTVGIRRHSGNFSNDVQAMNLGDSLVLEYVLATRPSLGNYGNEFRASINDRRVAALHTAFARRDFKAVRDIYQLICSSGSSWAVKLKVTIASLYWPLNTALAIPLFAIGFLRSYLISQKIRHL